MWIIIICAVIAIVWTWLEDDISFTIPAAIMGAIIGVLLAFFIGGFLESSKGKDSFRKTVELQNMQDNTITAGEFFLGSGSVDGVPHYSFYIKTGTNTYERRDIEADLAKIHYTDSDPHYIKTWKEPKKEKWLQPWHIDITGSYQTDKQYDFYIPRGSITSEYRLDAQ